MPACDICNDPPGPDAKRYTARQLRHAVDSGYLPPAATDTGPRVAENLGLDLGPGYFRDEWVAQVHRDGSDWLLCRSCAGVLDAHLTRHPVAAAPAPPPASRSRRRGLFGRRR